MPETRSVQLEVCGQKFAIKTDEDDVYLERLRDFVERRVRDIGAATRRDREDVALLALVNVADELFREKRRLERLRRDATRRGEALLAAVDQLTELVEAKELATVEAGVHPKR